MAKKKTTVTKQNAAPKQVQTNVVKENEMTVESVDTSGEAGNVVDTGAETGAVVNVADGIAERKEEAGGEDTSTLDISTGSEAADAQKEQEAAEAIAKQEADAAAAAEEQRVAEELAAKLAADEAAAVEAAKVTAAEEEAAAAKAEADKAEADKVESDKVEEEEEASAEPAPVALSKNQLALNAEAKHAAVAEDEVVDVNIAAIKTAIAAVLPGRAVNPAIMASYHNRFYRAFLRGAINETDDGKAEVFLNSLMVLVRDYVDSVFTPAYMLRFINATRTMNQVEITEYVALLTFLVDYAKFGNKLPSISWTTFKSKLNPKTAEHLSSRLVNVYRLNFE